MKVFVLETIGPGNRPIYFRLAMEWEADGQTRCVGSGLISPSMPPLQVAGILSDLAECIRRDCVATKKVELPPCEVCGGIPGGDPGCSCFCGPT